MAKEVAAQKDQDTGEIGQDIVRPTLLPGAQSPGQGGSNDAALAGSTKQVQQVILYDGVCGLCNRFIKQVLDGDGDGRFLFASLQGERARAILTAMGKDPSKLSSVYLVQGMGTDHMTLLAKGPAALAIMGQLNSRLRYLKYLSILPVWLLNLGYDLVAANRYRIFGRLDACPLPNPAHVSRFLDD